MTNDELKAAWAVNIDSREKYQEVFQRTRGYLPRNVWQNYAVYLPQREAGSVQNIVHESGDLWPLQRDMIREGIGFYPDPTTVIKWLRSINSNVGLGQMFPHVSPINKEEIAFTPDATQAKADRKQRMSVGRFLRKFLLFVPDSEIQRLDQQHRAELDTTFLLADTVDAIQHVYENMEGDSGCMRYGIGNFNHDLYHPSAVYCSPNMGVAYTEDANGVVKSRSVIWHNPNDPDDKRYVRIYGDVILKKKLEMNGYRMRGLAGAKLTIYRDPSFSNHNRVVMPWIDPAGGIHAQNADRSFDSEHAVRFKGEDFITLVTPAQKLQYQRAGIYPVEVQTQNGHVDVPEVDISTFHYECALSGRSSNRMDVPSAYWLMEDGTVRQARQDVVDRTPALHHLQIHREGRMQVMYCTADTMQKFGIPGYQSHYNDEDTRNAVGLAMLDKAFYADSERYAPRADCVFMEDAAGERRYIRKADALMLYNEEGDKFIHIDMVKALKADGCLPVAVLNGYRGIAHKSHPLMVQTRGGKRVITTRHDVTKLWNGEWEYSRNVVQMHAAGINVHIGKTEQPRDIVIPKEMVVERYNSTYRLGHRTGDVDEDMAFRDRRMLRDFSRGFMGGGTFMKKDDAIVQCDYYNKPTEAARMYEAAKGILTMQGDDEWLQRVLGYQRQHAIPWARVVVDAWEGMLEYDKAYEMAMAEANAVEAAPPMAAVIEVLNTLGDSDMDKLIAEVDDTLGASVVRRWPRLQQMAQMAVEQNGVSMSEAEDARIRETVTPDMTIRTVRNADGTVSPVPVVIDDSWVPGAIAAAEAVAYTPAPEPNFQLVNEDEALLRELQSAGLVPIVIDENTNFESEQQVGQE